MLLLLIVNAKHRNVTEERLYAVFNIPAHMQFSTLFSCINNHGLQRIGVWLQHAVPFSLMMQPVPPQANTEWLQSVFKHIEQLIKKRLNLKLLDAITHKPTFEGHFGIPD